MADENSDAAPEVTEDAPAGDQGAKGDDGKTFTQADLDRIVEQRIARERAKFGDYDDLKGKAAELQKIRDGEKTELQREREAREAAERERDTERFERLRERVANRPGKVVPVASLTGKTEEELIASADALIAWRDENAPKPPEPKQKRNPAGSGGGLKSGATGADSSTTDPKVKAAEALRRLRSGE
ncbi:head scaffolding protein [Mycobacterium phage Shandong1]|uniref:Scaffolding protein n=1 Tax=Mycobacterium phage Shandong1 TaxID=1983447 RepID=A0A1X9SHB3_9CAUD|nr:head scaffolding protein [Mycobacterium phage Shandong1]ARQ95448.1 scaffolding protein [Mycobacterium phage Shandong1]